MARSILNEPETKGERSSFDDVIDRYKVDVDRTLLIESLRMTTDERIERLIALTRFVDELREAAARQQS